MNQQIIFNAATERRLKNFLARPTHALILSAPTGSGKKTAALWLVSEITKQPIDKLTGDSRIRIVVPDDKSISIDQIRELSQFLKLKTTGADQLRRFVVIEQANLMTIEAQNAFLKLFEEPPADTLIIITANNPKLLLPTVLSRAQTINITNPTKTQLETAFQSSNFSKFYNMSDGRPGLLAALLNEEQHPLIVAIELAKKILGSNKFEQLAMIDELTKQKGDYPVLEALGLIADTGLSQASELGDGATLKRWQKILASTHETKNALQASAQSKLALTNLMLNL